MSKKRTFLFHETVFCCFRGCLKVLNDTESILNDFKGGIIQNLQMSPIPQTSFLAGTFFGRFLQQDSSRFFNNDQKCAVPKFLAKYFFQVKIIRVLLY